MPDMLVKLYTLPPLAPLLARQRTAGVEIRRGLVAEKHLVVAWVQRTFSTNFANECEVAFTRRPVSCFIATQQEQVIGFACHEATYKNFFGPMGVADSHQNKGIGAALLLACLHDMAGQGYAYAIIGWAGPVDFYRRTVGAIEIPDSVPGIYQGMLTG
jgi:GNAT superfamily N-acetyltransferase